MRLSTFALSVAALSISNMAYADVATAISGSVNVAGKAKITNDPSSSVSSSASSSWFVTPSNILASTTTTAASEPFGSVQVSATGTGNWASAGMGSYVGSNYGWNFAIANGSGGGSADLITVDDDWMYTFSLADTANFDLAYNVVGIGNTFGLQGWSLFIDGSNALNLWDSLDPTASGTFSTQLGAGTHTVSLKNYANIGAGMDMKLTGSMNGTFNWKLTSGAVPEPGTWAMMICGFGVIGGAMRRRPVAALKLS